jgi:maltoporin
MWNRQITPKLSTQVVGVYQYTDYGAKTKSTETWASVGFRSIYMVSKHFGVELEPGMDYINNPADNYDTCLFKLTGGIRISPGTIFNSRPAFRFFATYARWGDGFRGNTMLGGDAFVSQQEGMNYGIQCENWW